MSRNNTMPGAPSQGDLAKTQAGAETSKGTSSKYLWVGNRVVRDRAGNYTESGSAATEYPIVPFRQDPYDDYANVKGQFAQIQGANQTKSNWVVPFTDQDAAYELRKRTDDEQAQFDAWLLQKYDLTDPAQNNMLQSIAPSLFQRREEVIDSQQDLITRYSKIRLRGAKSEDDLRFQWLLDTGRLSLAKGPIWDPLKWRDAETGADKMPATRDKAIEDISWNSARYRAGWFSPIRYVTEDKTGHKADPNNYFNVAGTDKVYKSYSYDYPKKDTENIFTNKVTTNGY